MNDGLIFIYKNIHVPIKLTRSNRRSIMLNVTPLGELDVKAPILLSKNQIQKFINNQHAWIETKISDTKSRVITFSLSVGTTIPFLGKELNILQGSHSRGIKQEGNSIYYPLGCKEKATILREWYRDQARRILTELTDKYMEKLGLQYNKIYIKEQKTRWGSCSGKHNINYNWMVILTDMELIEYLVVHEVCHLKHLDHSQNFWNLVASYDPEFKKHRKKLQESGYYLLSFLK